MRRRPRNWHAVQSAIVLTLLGMMVTGCSVPLGGPHYISANSTVDPFTSARTKTERYYQAGLADEQQGNWSQALEDLRKASTWDPDQRQDIANALGRAQAQSDWQSAQRPGTAATAQSGTSSSRAGDQSTIPSSGTPPAASATEPNSDPVKHVASDRFPYAIFVPQDWVVKQARTAQQPADTFLVPTGMGSSALVMIMDESADFGITLDDLYIATPKTLNAGGIHNVQIFDRRQVAGQPAYILSYLPTSGAGMIAVRHAIFVTPEKAWHVILLATPVVTASLAQKFSAMLDAFEFTGSAFPTQ